MQQDPATSPRAYASRRPVENAYLVRQRDRRRLRELAAVLAAVLVVGAGLFSYTWLHIEILRTGYRVDRMEKELHGLLEKERRLRLEASYRSHPKRIEQRAADELAMQPLSLEQTLFYEALPVSGEILLTEARLGESGEDRR